MQRGSRVVLQPALWRSAVLRMRFDKEATGHGSETLESRSANTFHFADVPESMRPKQVPADFTPFPLPKYDSAMGFGPVRLHNIPDVETAQQRMKASKGRGTSSPRTTVADDVLSRDAAELEFTMQDDGVLAAESTQSHGEYAGRTAPPGAVQSSMPKDGDMEESDIGDGYRVDGTHFPVVDRIECQRSLDDLLEQFRQRPAREARTATVLDLANTLQRRSDAEIERMLYELGVLFAADGNGLQFLAAKVVKFGRGYYAADELMKAFIYLVDCLTETLVVEQPNRLARSPALFVQLQHFLAQIKVFEPNKWYSPNPNSTSNRADYTHPRGVNLTIAHKCTGEALYDYMAELVAAGVDRDGSPGLLGSCTDAQLIDMLAGFGAVRPDGLPESRPANAILSSLLERWGTEKGNVLDTVEDVAALEKLYFLMSAFNMKDERIREALLSSESSRQRAAGRTPSAVPPLQLSTAAQRSARGPDFFAGASREKDAAVQQRVARVFCTSMASAVDAGDADLTAALAESGFEFLLAMKDKKTASSIAREQGLDERLLRRVPGMEVVSERTELERAHRQQRIAGLLSTGPEEVKQALLSTSISSSLPLSGSSCSPTDVTSPAECARVPAVPYVLSYKGKRVRPIHTLLSDLSRLNQLDSLFLLHSSVVGGAMDAVVSAVRRASGGKDALLVTYSCLAAITGQALYSPRESVRKNAAKTLDIVGYELEKGRAVLVPPEEELAVHDAGTFCDEDLMLWTTAAFFARHLPLVRVNTLMTTRSLARNPQRTMKGEHSPLTSTGDLYNKQTPLLQSLRSKELRVVTHHALLRRKVRDVRSRVHDLSPLRSRFVYRRDKALFDKYHVTARNLAPGFSRGALNSDLRGLGYYTPDHPQVPYRPL